MISGQRRGLELVVLNGLIDSCEGLLYCSFQR